MSSITSATVSRSTDARTTSSRSRSWKARWLERPVRASVVADAVNVEGALEPSACDERNRDQRLWIVRRSGDDAHAWIEMRPVAEHRLAVIDGPPGDSLSERERRGHDLALPLAADEHGDQLALRLVGLVDVHVVVRDELGERVGDP